MKNKHKPRLMIIIVCCVIALMLLPSLIIYTRLTDKQLKAYITQTLDEISAHNVSSINDKISSDLILMNEIAERFSISGEGYIELLKGLTGTAGQHGFKRMGVVDKSGVVYSTDDAPLDIYDEDHIIRAFGGQKVISDVFPDDVDGKQIFVYAVPIFDDMSTSVRAVLFAACDTGNFRVHFSESAFNGEGYSYIVKANGATVTDSAQPSSFKNMTNVFNSMLASGDNAEAVEQMRSDMSRGEEKGSVIFTNTGVSKYMNYEALGINDWYMLSVVPTDVMDVYRNNIMYLTYVIVLVILAVTVVLTIALISVERSRNKQLEEVLYVDPLTGGISFTKFCMDAPKMIEKSTDKAACVMADLDNFRLINNLYGHAVGDEIILHTYKVFRNVIGDEGLLTRRVADRFYALVFFKNDEDLNNKLMSFITKLKTSWNKNETDYILNPAIGVCIVDSSEDIETTANNATIAHDGIDRDSGHIAFYDDVQRDKMKNNKVLEDRMEFAHKNHEFVPFLQPKYDAQTGKICGAEALVRWRNADGSITYPDRFIPLAERNGFIRVLDRDMFEAVCKLQRMIIDSKLPAVPISVNVSRQLMYESSFANDYVEIIKRYGLSPDTIELEITESVLFDDFDGFKTIIDTLRENGFKILMDDFGTGYSSLMMLSSVPIDNLKLDKSFIDRFEDDKGQKIINCVIRLAKSLDLPITAEGVETSGQCDFLKERGCDIIQGFYFSRPVPQERFVEMLKESAELDVEVVQTE